MAPRPKPGPERLAVRQSEAARMLGVSVDTFQRRIAPDLRAVRLGAKVRLYPLAELQRWLDENAVHVLDSGSDNR